MENIKSCRSCGAENPVAARYCGSCGGEISATVHCERCGSEQPAGISFCTECGSNLRQQGVVVPNVSADAPTRVDRCACGGLMKPKYKVGNGALSEVGGWLLGGEKRLFWVCQKCGQLKLHESQVEKERAKEAAAAVGNVVAIVGGCLIWLVAIVGVILLVRSCSG